MQLQGVNIREVWDFRLSSAVPMIVRDSGTWVVQIFAKENPDYNPKDPSTSAQPLEEHDTGIPTEDCDEHDTAKTIPCFEWMLSVRDKYALPDIEERKPLVAKINAANRALAELKRV